MKPLFRGGCYVISAGELSGDLIAADLVCEFRRLHPELKAYGVCGPNMLAAGVSALASANDFAFMGVSEIARSLSTIAKAEKKLIHDISVLRPDFVVCVDAFGLHSRLAKRLFALEIPCYQYVAPKLWAWGAWRTQKLTKYFRRCFGILEFEQEFFKKKGVAYTYVGLPHFKRLPQVPTEKTTHMPAPKIALLPGSRLGELRHIWPVMERVRREITIMYPQATFQLPLAEGLKHIANIKSEGNLEVFSPSDKSSLQVMADADLAVVASGTATLECALVRTPMVVLYRMSKLNYLFAKLCVKLPYVSLVNLMLSEAVVPEYIQHIPEDEVVAKISEILLNPHKQLAAFSRLHDNVLKDPEARVVESIVGDFC